MTTNLLEAIQARLPDDVVSKFATSTGEAPSRVRAAISSGPFVVVAGLIRRGSTKEGAAEILSHLRGSFPGRLGLLGERRNDLAGIISDASGVSHTSATGVLSTLTPIAAAVLAEEVRTRNLDAAGLSAFLLGQRNSLLGHSGAPPGIAAVLAPAGAGIGGGELVDEGARVTPRTATTTYISTRTKTPWLAMLAGLVVAALLLVGLFALLSPKVIQSTATAPVVRAPAMPQVGAPNLDMTRPPKTDLEKTPPAEVTGQTTITSGEVPKANANAAAKTGPKAALDADSLKTLKMNFDFASTKMTAGSEESVNRLAAMMREHPDARIRLEGHTDGVGDADINAPLSFKRAFAVKQKLVAAGVDEGRIETIGLREKRPVASNGTKEGRLENRRVDVVLIGK